MVINLDVLIEAWPMITGLILLVAWFIRLESKVLWLQTSHRDQKEEAQEKEAKMWAKIDGLQLTMTSILQSLAKIEGKLESSRD